jgi:hypothetical protein
MQGALNLVCGLPDDARVRISQLAPTVEFRWSGTASFVDQIGPERSWHPIWVGPSAPDQLTFEPGPVVNYIADPDLCGRALQVASNAARTLGRPWFNHPGRIKATSRDRVSDALQGIAGVHAPWVGRHRPGGLADLRRAIAEAGLAYPVLVRAVGEHGGRTLARIYGPDDDQALMGCLAMERELYISPFVDFADADGLYRRYRLAMVGGEGFLTSLVTAPHWKVHASSRIWNAATIAAEGAAVADFPSGLGLTLKPRLDEIHSRMGLDYFGIDFAMRPDGSMLIFEANAVMNMLGATTLQPDVWVESQRSIRAALLHLLDRPARWVEQRPEAAVISA